MSKKKRDLLINLGIGFGLAAVIFGFNIRTAESVLGLLCDACFVPAVLLLGFGGLVHARNVGFFDLLTYSVQYVFQTHYPGASIGHARDEDFIAYRDRKAKERKPATACLWTGLLFMILAVLFLILYYAIG